MTLSNHFVTSDQEIMSHAVHYNNWIFNLAETYLGQHVLEIGAGIGNISKKILAHPNVEKLTIVEIDPVCIEKHKINFNLSQNTNALLKIKYIQRDIANISLPANEFDTVICINVLEHVVEEDKALRNIYEGLCPGGFGVFLVPAFECLKGSIDKELGHYRRYNKNIIKNLLYNAGFKIINMRFYNVMGFLGWFLRFRILKARSQSKQQVIFFDKYIFPFQNIVEKFTPWQPIGQSLFFAVQKS